MYVRIHISIMGTFTVKVEFRKNMVTKMCVHENLNSRLDYCVRSRCKNQVCIEEWVTNTMCLYLNHFLQSTFRGRNINFGAFICSFIVMLIYYADIFFNKLISEIIEKIKWYILLFWNCCIRFIDKYLFVVLFLVCFF